MNSHSLAPFSGLINAAWISRLLKIALITGCISLSLTSGTAGPATTDIGSGSGLPDGFATLNGGTTGGGDANPVTVSTAEAFRNAVRHDDPAVVIVEGRLKTGDVLIGSNKTIIGADEQAGFHGGAVLVQGRNVIFKYLSFGPAPGDAMEISGGTNVFVTKCAFYDSTDELCSVVRGADYVTISWSKFYFLEPDSHSYAHLIGNSDGATGDRGKLHVTLHHNWYSTGVRGRMPRVRFGDVHLYNNYYNNPAGNYCVGLGFECRIRLENTVFENAEDPWADYGGTENGRIGWRNLSFLNCSIPTFVPNSFPVFEPPYEYAMHPVEAVKSVVMDGAGNMPVD